MIFSREKTKGAARNFLAAPLPYNHDYRVFWRIVNLVFSKEFMQINQFYWGNIFNSTIILELLDSYMQILL